MFNLNIDLKDLAKFYLELNEILKFEDKFKRENEFGTIVLGKFAITNSFFYSIGLLLDNKINIENSMSDASINYDYSILVSIRSFCEIAGKTVSICQALLSDPNSVEVEKYLQYEIDVLPHIKYKVDLSNEEEKNKYISGWFLLIKSYPDFFRGATEKEKQEKILRFIESKKIKHIAETIIPPKISQKPSANFFTLLKSILGSELSVEILRMYDYLSDFEHGNASVLFEQFKSENGKFVCVNKNIAGFLILFIIVFQVLNLNYFSPLLKFSDPTHEKLKKVWEDFKIFLNDSRAVR